ARTSVEFDDGWVWKFDAEQGSRMKRTGDIAEDLRAVQAKIALIYGQNSASFSAKSAAYMKSLQPALEVFEIADAQHHVFLDQPLAFVESLKSVLSSWSD
ncbi:MAG TPA: hypothetical protein VJ998_00155, partial [Pseudomonadales bacterium]|nr:hypothetical protein [Pseudomonadales bacterium]